MTPCNDSHENNSSEPSGRTLRHAFGKKPESASASGSEAVNPSRSDRVRRLDESPWRQDEDYKRRKKKIKAKELNAMEVNAVFFSRAAQEDHNQPGHGSSCHDIACEDVCRYAGWEIHPLQNGVRPDPQG